MNDEKTARLTFGLGIAFAGLFAAIYLCGINFFPRADDRLHIVALVGGIGVGITTIVLSFEWSCLPPRSLVRRRVDLAAVPWTEAALAVVRRFAAGGF